MSLAGPLQIVELKGLITGPVNLALGFSVGGQLPDMLTLATTGLIGLLGYGVSLALFVLPYATRHGSNASLLLDGAVLRRGAGHCILA